MGDFEKGDLNKLRLHRLHPRDRCNEFEFPVSIVRLGVNPKNAYLISLEMTVKNSRFGRFDAAKYEAVIGFGVERMRSGRGASANEN